MLDDLLAGETRHAPAWVRAQVPSDRPALRAAAEAVHRQAYELLLRDVAAFMAFKTPDPPPVVDKALFRDLVEAAMSANTERIRDNLSPLTLAQLYAIIRVCTAIQNANE